MMKSFIFLLGAFLFIVSAYARTPEFMDRFKVSTELESKHIWRGLLSSDTPAFTGEIGFEKGNFSTGFWMAQSLNQEYSEMDFSLSYSIGKMSLTLYDYFCPKANKVSEFTNFSARSTDHSIDLEAVYTPTEQIPLTLLGSVLLYGDDRNPESLRNYYSIYVELGYKIYSDKNKSVNAKMGLTPYESIYGKQMGIANMQLSMDQSLVFSEKISFPLRVEFIASPLNKAIYMNFHVGLFST